MTEPRTFQARVSKHQRNRIFRADYVRGEHFTLSANFAACLGDETIASVIWRVNETQSVILGSASKTDTVASVACTAGSGPGGVVKCEITDTAGNVFNQLFEIGVRSSPWYNGESAPSAGNSSASA